MSRPAMVSASRPERRMTARALRPGGVASAMIDSSAPGSWTSGSAVDSSGTVLEDVSGFEDAYITTLAVLREQRPESVDCVERAGSYVLEGSPMVRYEIPRFEPVEQVKRVVSAEMAASKSWLPPRCVANRQQGNVEPAAVSVKSFRHNLVRVGRQGGIPREKARLAAGIHEVHVRRATPPDDRVPASPVARRSGVDDDVADSDLTVRRQGKRVGVAQPYQPGCDCRGCE